jgi:hypothetical protein
MGKRWDEYTVYVRSEFSDQITGLTKVLGEDNIEIEYIDSSEE